MEGPCVFCGRPVSESNYQVIRQALFDRVEDVPDNTSQPPYREPAKMPVQVVFRTGGSKFILMHSICDTPPDIEARLAPVNKVREVEQPRHVHYIDIGDLPYPEVLTYLERLKQALQSASPDEVFLQPVRTNR